MPRRSGDRLRAARATLVAATGLVVVSGAGCQTGDAGAAGCQVSRQAVLPGTPLTLLAHARLDRVGDGFMLSGVDDDRVTVRWAALDGAGAMGPEQQLVVPSAAGGPWLVFTSLQQPGDTALVAQARPAANATDAELRVIAVPTTGAPTPAPGPVLAVIPAALAGGVSPVVAFAASRSGGHAVLAWADPAGRGVETLTLSASGQAMGVPVLLDDPAPRFDCLAFAPGKSDLTLVYYRYADAVTHIPTMVITELVETGSVDNTVGPLGLTLESHAARCPRLAPTEAGYALAFQDLEGAWLGTYVTSTNQLALDPFAAAVTFGSADLQPPLVALTPMGADYAVVFARVHAGELWRLDGHGVRRPGVLTFPSAQGNLGDISTQAATGTLQATYADYTSLDAGVGAAGQRYFLGATCL
jgi:hypothetical protein